MISKATQSRLSRHSGFSVLLAVLLGVPVSQAQESPVPATATKLSGSSTVAYTNSMEVLDDSRVLGIGDRISFRVVEDRKEPVSLVITDSGEMEVPLIGRVQAANRTCKQLAHAVRAPLEKTYFYKATVIVGLDVMGVRSKGRIYVTGQVRSQGPMEIPADETLTLSKAILRAGGLADFANKKNIKLMRKIGTRQETTIVNLQEIMEKGMVDKDPVLKADDLIFVQEKGINF